MKKIIISGIEINVIKKNIKNVNLSVHPPNGNVRISAPLGMKDETIKSFVVSKIPWIKKQQAKFETQGEIIKNEYISGETHYFLGNGYILNIIHIDKNPSKVEIRDTTHIDLYIKVQSTKEQREKVIKEWYRKELKLLIPPLIKKWEERMGVEVAEFGVKQMKTRWGTCNISARRIWINLELAKKSPHCLEYIVVHEMVHLLERNHNERFRSYMDQFLPHWKSVKTELNR